jgi:hypothetical protein
VENLDDNTINMLNEYRIKVNDNKDTIIFEVADDGASYFTYDVCTVDNDIEDPIHLRLRYRT